MKLIEIKVNFFRNLNIMIELSSLAAQCGLIITGILWGTTNVALETNTENDAKIHNSKST